MSEQSPEISGLSWGTTEVADHGSFKDAKLWPGGARGWDWNETGTSHSPGIQPDDVSEILDHGAQTVILSRGQQNRLQVMDDTVAAIEDRGATSQILTTTEAVERYNELAAQGRAVGALIHSTC